MKRYLIAILIILLLASGIITACATTENYSSTTEGYITYQNKEDGFTVDYPSQDWKLRKLDKWEDERGLESFEIQPIELTGYAGEIWQYAYIYVYDSDPSSSIEEEITRTRHNLYSAMALIGDFRILWSKPLEGKWDWLVEYEYCYPNFRFLYERDYFKKTNNLLYIINVAWDSKSMPVELQGIVNSFQVTESSFPHK